MIEFGKKYVKNLIGVFTLRFNYFPYFRSHVNIGNRKRPKNIGSIFSRSNLSIATVEAQLLRTADGRSTVT
jgi:hypothetical protein